MNLPAATSQRHEKYPLGESAGQAATREQGMVPVHASDKSLQDQFAELVSRIQAGEEAALEALYRQTAARLYAVARRIVVNDQTCEEVVLDTYLQVWRTAERYDASRGAVLAWLLTICRSRALDALRRREELLVHASPEVLERASNMENPAEMLLSMLEDGSRIRRAMEGLNPQQRQLVALAFFRGLTHGEIAAHLGIPLGTVKSGIRRALQAMRNAMEAG